MSISRDEMVRLLRYCPHTGTFVFRDRGINQFKWTGDPYRHWRWWCSNKAGKAAGWVTTDGYLKISVANKKVFAHRAAYLIVHGCSPPMIDHINGDPSDNRIENLRGCRDRSNQFNIKLPETNTSGYKGVSWSKSHGKWLARVGVDNRRVHVGRFNDPLEAARAYDRAAIRFHGNYARTNKSLGLIED